VGNKLNFEDFGGKEIPFSQEDPKLNFEDFGGSEISKPPEEAKKEGALPRDIMREEPKPRAKKSTSLYDTLKSGAQSFSKGARNVAAGIGDVGDLFSLPITATSRALGLYDFKPMGEQIGQGIDTATGGYTKPVTKREKVSEAVARAVTGIPVLGGGASALMKLLGTTSRTGKVAKGLKDISELTPQNIGSTALASGTTQHILNQDPEQPLVAPLAGLLAAIGGNAALGATKLGARSLTKAGRSKTKAMIGENLSVNPEKVEAMLAADMPLTLNAVTDSGPVQRAYNITRKSPFAGPIIHEADLKQLAHIENVTGMTPESLKNLTPEAAGKLAKSGIDTYKTNLGKKMGDYELELEKYLKHADANGNNLVNIDAPLENLLSKLTKLKGPAAQESFMKTPIGKDLNYLQKQYAEFGGAIPYENLKAFLANLRENKITTFGLIGKKTQGEIKHLEKGLTKSIGDYFSSISPEAKKIWGERNAFYSQYAQDVKPHFNDILKAYKNSEPAAFNKIFFESKNSARKLKPLYEAFSPDEAQDFTHMFLNKLGAANRKGDYNAFTMADKFRGLPKPTQHVLLSGFDNESRKKFPKVVDAVRALGEGALEGNPSQTAYTQNFIDTYNNLMKKSQIGLAALATGNLPLATTTAALAAVPIIATKFAAKKIFTNPDFIKGIYDGMKANPKQAPRYLESLTRRGKAGRLILTEIQTMLNNQDAEQERPG
jgi:hypothetical protein